MALKRKRSESELSLSSSETSSQFSSPQRPLGPFQSFDFGQGLASPFQPFPIVRRAVTPAHLPSRTMKRHRNNRPAEEEVHQHTLNLMYRARPDAQDLATPLDQLALPIATPKAPEPAIVQRPPVRPPLRPTSFQRSLHSFWTISTPPLSAAQSEANEPSLQGLTPSMCDDCGVSLQEGNAGLNAMDVDSGLDCTDGTAYTCGCCAKVVCFGCSIGNLGATRRCLMCIGT